MSNFVATDFYELFNIHVENPEHDCVKPREGGQGLFINFLPDVLPYMAMDLNFDNLDTNRYCRYYVVHAYLVHTGVGHTANTSKHLLLSLEGSAFIIIFSSYSLIFQIPNSVKCIFFLHSEIPKSVR